MVSPSTPVTSVAARSAQVFPQPLPVPAWKRPLDILLIALSLPITLPVMVMITLWVRLLSSGSLFFVQERIGYGGRRFGCLKFRTMYEGASTSTHERHLQKVLHGDGPMVKLDAVDPRLIPGARLIRALGLDELPQLINVVRGDMSLTGPRPCTPFELERYAPEQLERFSALPGLTGLWQVSGKNDTTFDQMIELDVEYLRNPSLGRDLTILLLTPRTVLEQLSKMIENRRRLAMGSGPFPSPAARAGVALGTNSVRSDMGV